MNITRGIHADGGSVGAEAIVNSIVQVINANGGSLSEERALELEEQYLRRLMHDCGGLDWLGSIRYQDEQTPRIALDSVYTALMTTQVETRMSLNPEVLNRESKLVLTGLGQLSALEVLNRESKLVLTGDPGSGKSAFVNYIVLCLAGEALEDPTRNLKALTESLPDDAGEPKDRPQSWDHGPLVPLRVFLRDFVASRHFPPEGDPGDTAHLIGFVRSELERQGLAEYFPVLEQRLRAYGGLVMLDGLDEVPQFGARRERLVRCVAAFAGSFQKVRLLVTCRPYAYEQASWRIRDFGEAKLAKFGPGQIRRFVDRWYGGRPEYDPERARERAEKLKQAVLDRPALHELAARPLLLTLTAYLHAFGHDLPERRADLYERLMELLIDKWEKARFRAEDAEAARTREQYSLAEFLRVGMDDVRLVLERLAFQAHAEQEGRRDSADIPGHRLISQLVYIAGETGTAPDPRLLSEYLRDRVGVLYQRGGSGPDAVYSFPHLSFQEYLAAAYLRREEAVLFERFPEAESDEWPDLAAWLGRCDPDRWGEVVRLAGGIKSVKEPGPVWRLVDALSTSVEEKGSLSAQNAWGLWLAGEILVENLERTGLPPKRQRVMQRIQRDLPQVLAGDALPATERVAAGLNLEVIGDTRTDVTDVDAMTFCGVLEGVFFLGATVEDAYERSGDHALNYYYWLARYPVTVVQFRQFVEAKQDFEPRDSRCLNGPANTPVVRVSWDEAVAFCDWLTERWREWGWLPEGCSVGLPSEPEWEKAAKGGYRIPQADEMQVRTIAETTECTSRQPELQDNPEPRRPYPWGSDVAPERMNFNMNIGRVSSVGAYPGGRSPCGCEEMSGNVWEWTRSKREDCPYPEDDAGRRVREQRGTAARRVLRGGSFLEDQRFARCSSRNDRHPGSRYNYIGFRVVLSPFL